MLYLATKCKIFGMFFFSIKWAKWIPCLEWMWGSVVTCTDLKSYFKGSRYLWMTKTCLVSSLTVDWEGADSPGLRAAVREVTELDATQQQQPKLPRRSRHPWNCQWKNGMGYGRGGRNPPGNIKFIYLTLLNQYLEGESCEIYLLTPGITS